MLISNSPQPSSVSSKGGCEIARCGLLKDACRLNTTWGSQGGQGRRAACEWAQRGDQGRTLGPVHKTRGGGRPPLPLLRRCLCCCPLHAPPPLLGRCWSAGPRPQRSGVHLGDEVAEVLVVHAAHVYGPAVSRGVRRLRGCAPRMQAEVRRGWWGAAKRSGGAAPASRRWGGCLARRARGARGGGCTFFPRVKAMVPTTMGYVNSMLRNRVAPAWWRGRGGSAAGAPSSQHRAASV
jgi:hypothetical protein